MSEYDDPVDAVILAFLAYMEGVAPRPTLDHLADKDRLRAAAYLDGIAVARGIDPYTSRPAIESLLADTPLAGLLPALRHTGVDGADVDGADLAMVRTVLVGVDGRAQVEIDADIAMGASVVFAYLDLRARFLLVPNATPVVTEEVRAAVKSLFDGDPDTSRVCVVATRSGDLLTQVLAADEIGHTITTPRGEPHLRWDPPLPLAMAARRMLEQSAPEWPAFDFDEARIEALDVSSVAAGIARRIIAHESARSYRGDKRRAYKALVGHEHVLAELVARIAEPGTELDLDVEITRIVQAAA
jgi:hypothetical protein